MIKSTKDFLYNNLGLLSSISIVTLPISWGGYGTIPMMHLLAVACLCFWIHDDRDNRTKKESEKK